jgi:DNA-binding LacI/PurR family transcriptional regulator
MSITKVAKVAGVSHATVSNVINNRPNVRADTARTVRRAMDEIGYKPRPVGARPGRRSRTADGVRTGVIALVWPGDPGGQNSIAAGLIEGISAELTRQNLKLRPTFASPHVTAKDFAEMVGDADGCLIHGTLPERFHSAIRSKPVVWLGTVGPTDWGDRVGVDNAQLGRDAARRLDARGARRFAYVSLDCDHPAYVARGLWFTAEVRRLGCEIDGVIETPSPQADPGHTAQAAQRLLDLCGQIPGEEPVGVFVSNDRHLAMLERECRVLGSDLFERVSLIACDHDQAALAGLTTRPDTFQIQPALIGRLAVDRLLARMRKPETPGQITVQVPAILVPADAGG